MGVSKTNQSVSHRRISRNGHRSTSADISNWSAVYNAEKQISIVNITVITSVSCRTRIPVRSRDYARRRIVANVIRIICNVNNDDEEIMLTMFLRNMNMMFKLFCVIRISKVCVIVMKYPKSLICLFKINNLYRMYETLINEYILNISFFAWHKMLIFIHLTKQNIIVS